jgi:hypothetical protein
MGGRENPQADPAPEKQMEKWTDLTPAEIVETKKAAAIAFLVVVAILAASTILAL